MGVSCLASLGKLTNSRLTRAPHCGQRKKVNAAVLWLSHAQIHMNTHVQSQVPTPTQAVVMDVVRFVYKSEKKTVVFLLVLC